MDAVEEVKSRLSIEDVIAEYVQLKRAGRNFKGLSPFGNEKTPSFMVSPEKQIWHDFSSGKGGNMFSFVMEVEGVDFKTALEMLARKAGVDLSQYQTGRNAGLSKQKERCYEVVEMAARFYQVQFSKNQQALEYILQKRLYTKDTALLFRIGYSPNNGDALVKYLRSKGVDDKDIKQAGLSVQRMNGTTDMFRGRLMIPLCDAQGRVVGFTARILEDDPNAPKYINTPQTILYDKSRNVFGLHLAKDSIRKQEFSVMVEGNLDVIASHQAGITNVVATAGTALTEQQLKALQRFSGEVRLAFDQDRAGLQATERSIPIASKVGVSLSMITIPTGKDPDELIKKDPKLWEDAIKSAQPALDWLIERYQAQLDLTTASGKRQFSDIVLGVIRSVDDEVERDHYIEKIAGIIGVAKEALVSKMGTEAQHSISPRRKSVNTQTKVIESNIELIKIQSHLLALVLMKPSLRKYLKLIREDMLEGDDPRAVLSFLQTNPDFSGDLNQLKDLRKSIDYVKMLTLQYETLYQSLDEVEQTYEAQRLQVRLIEKYVKTKKNILSVQMGTATDNETQQLLQEAKALDALLKESKEIMNGKETKEG